MTKKTGKEIEGDVFALLRSSYLITGRDGVAGIGGSMYRKGMRPRDSREEDLVVIFTAGTSTQFQEGVVTLNIYVPDIYQKNGLPEENGERCEQIERLAQDTVDLLTAGVSDYLFSVERSRVIHTQREEAIHQSFIVVPLSFRYYGSPKLKGE